LRGAAWTGCANDLQRLRSCACGRVVNDLTGTPLARLSHASQRQRSRGEQESDRSRPHMPAFRLRKNTPGRSMHCAACRHGDSQAIDEPDAQVDLGRNVNGKPL
jgi:hypothetical protein